MTVIDEKDIDRLKEIFVTRQECDTVTEKINKDIAQHNIDLALIKQDLSLIKKIDWLILSLVVAAVVGAVMNLIITAV